jgi:cation-transporting ATPase E
MAPTMAILVYSQLQVNDELKEAIRVAVGGMVAMIPQGLVLLTSVAFAVGVVRLGRRNVLVQELAAVEGLARVDVICFDKTGTLTEGRMSAEEILLLVDEDEAIDLTDALGALAGSEKAQSPSVGRPPRPCRSPRPGNGVAGPLVRSGRGSLVRPRC